MMIFGVMIQILMKRKKRRIRKKTGRPCASFRLHGARGEVLRGGGRNILPSTPVAAKRTSADGGGTGVSSQDEVLEEAPVGTVGEGGGRPGPHPKPNKGWGTSGVCIGVDGVAVGRDLECEEVECEGDEQEEAEKCGGKGKAGGMGDGIAN